MPSAEAKELLEELRAGVAERLDHPDDAKRLYERAMSGFRAPEGTELSPARAGGVDGLRVTAAGADPRIGILYLHGGGFAVGSAASNQDLLARLSHAAGVSAIGIDYRLLPEHPFPAALEDTLAAAEELAGASGPLVIAGASAGAALAIGAALRTSERGGLPAAGLLCLSPWVDLTVSAPSLAVEDEDWFGRDALILAANHYLDGREPTDPLASPLHADLSGLPPLLIQVGGSEILLDDARRLADAARRAGTPAELDVWPGMFHNFQLFASRLDEGVAALERAGAWVQQRLRGE